PRCRRRRRGSFMAFPWSNSITSSASASSVGGTSRPSAFAVLRSIVSSYLVGCLYRQVGRLLALEDAVDVSGGVPVLVKQIGPIRNQAAAIDHGSPEVNCRQSMPCREPRNQLAMRDDLSAPRHEH